MVNTIDTSARRDLVADAVFALVAEDGVAAASVRRIADRTGLATGSVRHFFASQHALHAFAMQELADRIGRRVRAHADVADPVARCEAMVCELLPLTDEAERELRAWVSFVAASRGRSDLRAIADRTFTATRSFLEDVVEHLRGRAHARAAEDLHVLVDGVTFQLLHWPELFGRRQARDVIGAALRGAVGGG